jgi:hypothetical protein
MAFAPTRAATALAADGTPTPVFWDTTWTPTSVRGVYHAGDQTALAADGRITFLDCHVLPHPTPRVYPFGDWPATTVDPVVPTLTIEEHPATPADNADADADADADGAGVGGPTPVHTHAVTLDLTDDGVYFFPVAATTRRVVQALDPSPTV